MLMGLSGAEGPTWALVVFVVAIAILGAVGLVTGTAKNEALEPEDRPSVHDISITVLEARLTHHCLKLNVHMAAIIVGKPSEDPGPHEPIAIAWLEALLECHDISDERRERVEAQLAKLYEPGPLPEHECHDLGGYRGNGDGLPKVPGS